MQRYVLELSQQPQQCPRLCAAVLLASSPPDGSRSEQPPGMLMACRPVASLGACCRRLGPQGLAEPHPPVAHDVVRCCASQASCWRAARVSPEPQAAVQEF